jgi:hypothetical protein
MTTRGREDLNSLLAVLTSCTCQVTAGIERSLCRKNTTRLGSRAHKIFSGREAVSSGQLQGYPDMNHVPLPMQHPYILVIKYVLKWKRTNSFPAYELSLRLACQCHEPNQSKHSAATVPSWGPKGLVFV